MYSSYGKQSSSRYAILKEKSEILSGVQKIYHVDRPRFDTFKKGIDPETLMRMIKESLVSEKKKTKKKEKPQKSSSFLSQSREDFYKATSVKKLEYRSIYNCKYQVVDKKPKTARISPDSKSQGRIIRSSLTKLNPQLIQKHIQSPISFDKQLPRSERVQKDEIPDSNGNEPPKKYMTPDISKCLGRDLKFLNSNIPMVSYDPSFKLVSENLGKVMGFDKYSKREPMIVKQLVNSRNYKPNYNSVQKRSSTPDLSRGRHHSPFPEHMAHHGSRICLSILSEKMLKMNMYVKK